MINNKNIHLIKEIGTQLLSSSTRGGMVWPLMFGNNHSLHRRCVNLPKMTTITITSTNNRNYHQTLTNQFNNSSSTVDGPSSMMKQKKNDKIQMMAEMMLNKKGQLNEFLGIKLVKLNMVINNEDNQNTSTNSSSSIDELFIEMSMKLSDVHMNAIGLVHGGSFATLCDTAIGCGALIYTNQYLAKNGCTGMAVLDNYNQFLKSASVGDELRVVAKPLHLGRSTQTWEATVYSGEQKIALSRSTILNKSSSAAAPLQQSNTSGSGSSKPSEKVLPASENLNKLGKNFNIDTMNKMEIAARFDKYSEQWDFLTTVSDYRKNVIPWIVKDLSEFGSSSNQQLPQNFKVLDMATGIGLIGRSISMSLSQHVKNLEITGLDISPGMIQKAKETNLYSNLFVHDLDQPLQHSLPENESFDLITCIGVTEMLQNMDQILLKEIARLLSTKPHSHCLISFQFNDGTGKENTAGHQGMKSYTLSQITTMLESCNLKLISHSILPNAYYLPSPTITNTALPVPFIMIKCSHNK